MNTIKKTLFFLLMIIIISVTQTFSLVQKDSIRIMIPEANIFIKPSFHSRVIGWAPMGTVINEAERIGDWYKVNLFFKNNSFLATAFIHLSTVEIEDKTTKTRNQYSDETEITGAIHLKNAYKCYKMSAEKGNANAQYNLGFMYYNGYGVLKDYKKAFKWYTKAAQKGNSKAQTDLGIIYIYGNGVLKDMKMAKYWIKKAYDNGNGKAKQIWELFELWKY